MTSVHDNGPTLKTSSRSPIDPRDKGARLIMDLSTVSPSKIPDFIAAESILFRPCAWHETREELDRLNRAYPGQVSHGMCSECSRRLMAELDAREVGL